MALALGVVALGIGGLKLTADSVGFAGTFSSLTFFAVGIPVAGAVAALVHWAPKLVGGTFALPAAGLAGLAVSRRVRPPRGVGLAARR